MHFDATARESELAALPRVHQQIFAASCACRLLPQYERFAQESRSGDWPLLRRLAARVWRHLAGDPMSAEELGSAIEACMAAIPPEDEAAKHASGPYAEDAAASLAYTIRSVATDSPKEALWASQRVYDSVDVFAGRELEGHDDGDVSRLKHAATQRELKRQERDLKELAQSLGGDARATAVAFKNRAAQESQSVIQP